MANWTDLNFWKTKDWENLRARLKQDQMVVVPRPSQVLRPLIQTSLEKTRVMMVFPETTNMGKVANGQAIGFDPAGYGVEGSMPYNYYALSKELKRTRGYSFPKDGDLSYLARRGVLMWNAVPTALVGYPKRHCGIGWEKLTKEIVETLYLYDPKTIFVFFGTEGFGRELPKDANVFTLPPPYFPIEDEDYAEGSDLFTAINALQKANKRREINWKP